MVFLKIMNPLQKICASQSVKGEGGGVHLKFKFPILRQL